MTLGKCDRCGQVRMVNARILGRAADAEQQWCADCFDADQPPLRRPPNQKSGPHQNNPGFDNVIRALEEDR